MTHLKIGIPSLKGSKGRNPPPLMGKKMQNRTLEIPDLNATKSSKSRLTPTNAQTQYSLFKQAKMYLQTDYLPMANVPILYLHVPTL